MFKACSKCGKIHKADYTCKANSTCYASTNENKQRSTFAWTEKSREIREKANYLCELCRQRGVYAYEAVAVHHITKLREAPERLLDNYNLVCLCKSCHIQADNGEISKEFLESLAKIREER